MKPRERFLRACRSQSVDFTPVWFMRRAGRYLPGYREIRKKYAILDAAKNPEICEEITLMPVKELGVDAAVMFADIIIPLEGMGVNFSIEENLGPVISNPIRSIADVEESSPFRCKTRRTIRAGSCKKSKGEVRSDGSCTHRIFGRLHLLLQVI